MSSFSYIETGLFDAVITHNRYTLLNTNADPLIDAAAQRGMAVLNAAPYGSGMLSRGPDPIRALPTSKHRSR